MLDEFGIELYGKCDRIEVCSGFSRLTINRMGKTASLGGGMGCLTDCAMLATCLIATGGGFGEDVPEIREVQIFSVENDKEFPIAVRDYTISGGLVDKFEKALFSVLAEYANNNKSEIVCSCDDIVRHNRYRHFGRI
jgi:hypothetical protein